MDKNYACKIGTKCYTGLSKVESIAIGGGTPSVMPIYDKISNKSASCVRNGTTYYETLCTGTPEERCPSSKIFTPNGCVSSGYHYGFRVTGTRWGTCGCNTANGEYDTIDTCRNKTGTGCASTGGCYRTCKSLGYYSTEADCKKTNYKVTCRKIADCYEREMQGFLIKYDESSKRKAICGHTGYTAEAEAYLEIVLSDSEAGTYPETVDGRAYSELPDDNSKGYQYPAGTYYLCYRRICLSNAGTEQSCPNFDLRALQLLRTTDYNSEFTQEVCFTGGVKYNGFSGTCENSHEASNNRHPCKKVTFKAGKTYKVKFAISGMYDSSCTYK